MAEKDVVSHILKFCRDHAFAKKAFQQIVVEKNKRIQLPDGEVQLTDEEMAEFVERFSAEIEPTLYTPKRL
ncbi:MAG: hypothetical protein AB7F21_08205 [Desulfuromonadales bacterium]|uniref:hypothetical protein n=1 Tax=Desulfuromonas sp. KJ2020 TaxID=2919173 RepID=UPI000326655C|nr:hypothetical protein [Desulfuromonas sp. KJ2020]MCP3175993.1 hypothetical protein [Desulfuromonas sp. KJ2020]